MARQTRSMNNLASVGEMIGALRGINDGLDDEKYTESLIKQAHGEAKSAFDLAAAATASAGHLQHVFEFGVAGITPGPIKYPDPTSEAAQLWVHRISGRGGSQDIDFTFRPALNPNPQPTVKGTGVQSKYLQRMSKRKYLFWNKAFVMESGQTVEIHPKNSDYLFVPFYGQTPKNPNNNRGYVMWNASRLGPITATPGKTTKGSFTAFWMAWWAGQGSQVMEGEMRRQVTEDINAATRQAARRANAVPVRPAAANNVMGSAARARSWARNLFRRMG